MESLIPYTGAIASVWIVIGIYIASLFYPDYNHAKQFCSELGALNSPTQKLSPAINNYPLGLLFVIFGLYLATLSSATSTTVVIGLMVITHGVGTWICGLFPMDSDPYTQTPSNSGKIHSWAGMGMLISLIVAPATAALSNTLPSSLRLFSIACILGCVFFSYKLALAYKAMSNPGLHQRLSYGFQVLWLFVYSIFVASGN